VFSHTDMTSIMIRVENLVLKTLYIQLFYFKSPFDLVELREIQEHYVTGEYKVARIIFRKTYSIIKLDSYLKP
jgi:hypothetical protein